MVEKNVSLRATFEDVLKYQTELRHLLENLIKENRSLKPDEREKFLDLINRSCLGLELRGEVHLGIFPSTITETVHFLSNVKVNKVRIRTKIESSVPMDTVGISVNWKALLFAMLPIWAMARDRSTSISAERIPYEKMPGDSV